MGVPLQALHVIGIRYRDSHLAPGDARGLDAYAAAGVYEAAGVPVTVSEPRFPEEARTGVEENDLGVLGGVIAEHVAAASRDGKAILMTGGNCSHITGVFGGLQDAHGPSIRVGLVWFDAHGDFNTPQTTLSGMYGGMPVAVCAGLGYPTWREGSHIVAPLPTDRIVMVDVRNLDPDEERLIRAVGIPIAAVAPDRPGVDLAAAVQDLAARCDLLYLHVDTDVLDERFTPDHGTKEPNGPDVEQVLAAIDTVMATGKVGVYAVVAVNAGGPHRDECLAPAFELIRGGLAAWRRYGMAPLRRQP